jgi:hypothetical protein
MLAFDLRRSDLALQVAFPLLLANLTGWLAPSESGVLPAQVQPGAVVSFFLPPEVQTVRAIRPDGNQVDVEVRGGQATLADTHLPGIYRVTWGDRGQAAFAVNLFAPSESDIAPAAALSLGTGDAAEGGSEPGREVARNARREWWRLPALVALWVLFAEWLVYYRSTLARLWAQARGMLARAARRR